jgi:mycothiol synthase
MRLRPPTVDDVPAIAAVTNGLMQSLYGRSEVSEAEYRVMFGAPDFDPAGDALVATDDDDTIVGYADLSDPSGEGRRIWIMADVLPGRGPQVGGALLDAIEAKARARQARGGCVKVYLPSKDEAMAALLAERGYEVTRHSFRMEADLAAEPTAPVWPEGITVRGFRAGVDDEAVYVVQEETFADQFEATPLTYEEWRHWSFGTPFDPILWFLAEEGAQLAGILLGRPERGGDETLGWVSVLGVRRRWRRRGLGRALLLHAFGELRRRGKARVGLGVDGESPTGAVHLYTAVGMEVVRRSDHWQKDLLAHERAPRAK